MLRRITTLLLLGAALVAGIAACSDTSAGRPNVSVLVAPASATVPAGADRTFDATVHGSGDSRVTWDASCGSLTSQGTTAVFTAPAVTGTCTLRATSVAAADRSGVAVITIVPATPDPDEGPPADEPGDGEPDEPDPGDDPPEQDDTPLVRVAIDPLEVTLTQGERASFTALVTGSPDVRVSWSRTCGTIEGEGTTIVYRAPANPTTCRLTARSRADAGAQASATITVVAPPPADDPPPGGGTPPTDPEPPEPTPEPPPAPDPVVVQVEPEVASLRVGRSLELTASIQGTNNPALAWQASCGSLQGDGATVTFTAPDDVATCVVSAVSAADPDAGGRAVITVLDPMVTEHGVVLAAGTWHSAAIRTDGSVWTWGLNLEGQLGDGTTTSSSTPVRVAGIDDARAVAVGGFHTLVLRANGTVAAVGRNDDGQLGDGTTVGRTLPVPVAGGRLGLGNVVAVAAGSRHSVALRADGTVWTWGVNEYGQLGLGDLESRSSATRVDGLDGVVAVAAGDLHTLALRADGTVWAWGSGASGQLGGTSGAGVQRSVPGPVPGVTDAVAIAAGTAHALALRSDGTVLGWGFNGRGQLGNGRTDLAQTDPVQVLGLTDVRAIAAGAYHSLALTGSRALAVWGRNELRELGDGTTTDRSVPFVRPATAGALAVAGGGPHTLALAPDGTVVASGRNNYGQLGDGRIAQRSDPVFVEITGVGSP